MTRFTVTQIVSDYVSVDGNYKNVEAKNKFVAENFDDLQNLIMTLIDFSKSAIKFEVYKEEGEE
jgi:hypothetical protein